MELLGNRPAADRTTPRDVVANFEQVAAPEALATIGRPNAAQNDDLPPEEWTPGYADFASACSGVMYPMAEWIR